MADGTSEPKPPRAKQQLPGVGAATAASSSPSTEHADVNLTFTAGDASPSHEGVASPVERLRERRNSAAGLVAAGADRNAIFSSLELRTKSGRLGQKTPGRRVSKRAHVGTGSSPRVVEAHDRLLALRSLDGGLLEMHLRRLGDASIESLLDGLGLLDSVFGPVAALTMQRYGRGYVARRKHERSKRHDAAAALDERGAHRGGGLAPLANGTFQETFQGTCLVLGALNMDLKAEADATWPKQGTTTVGAFFASPGGKGGNEAVALACLGIPTHLAGQHG